MRTVDRNKFIPYDPPRRLGPHPKQRQFLLLSNVLEVFYGGAGGGGKSDALLMAAAQYVAVPGYSAVLLRSSFPDLSQADGLIPRSKEWWYDKAEWSEKHCRWTFPSGATIKFGYLDSDASVEQYRGGAFQFIGIDELTQHSEFRYRFLFSRLRKLTTGPLAQVPLRMRSASNPGGIGHYWVRARFIDQKTRQRGAVFVPAKMEDNPSLDQEVYRASLALVDPVTRAQIEEGDWDSVAGGRFKSEWFQRRWRRGPMGYYLRLPGVGDPKIVERLSVIFQTVDPASSEKNSSDWTVISTWGLTANNEMLWLDCERVQLDIPDIVPFVHDSYRRHKATFTAIEGVASNVAVYQYCNRLPMVVKLVSPLGMDKLVRATPAMVLAEAGRIYVPENAPWLDDALWELIRFTGDDKKDAHDDVVDTVSYAAQALQGRLDSGKGFRPHVVK